MMMSAMMSNGKGVQADDAGANNELYNMYLKTKVRDGSKDSPVRDCRELFTENPEFKSGTYWVDPDGGSIANAIQAYCRKEMKSTCINAKTSEFATKSYVTQQLDNQPFVAKHMGTAFFEYQAESSQLNFLRIHSERAKQTLTYRCINSVAVEDAYGRKNKSVILYTAGDKEYTATDSRFQYSVLQDDCKYAKSSEAQTVIEIDTKTATHLPIIDIAPGDIGTTHKEFGVQLGEVCFS